MDQALQKLIKDGRITPLAAYEKAIDKEIFAKMIPAAEKAPPKTLTV
jgi:hypothetical protein